MRGVAGDLMAGSSEPVASEPVASEPVASEPVASGRWPVAGERNDYCGGDCLWLEPAAHSWSDLGLQSSHHHILDCPMSRLIYLPGSQQTPFALLGSAAHSGADLGLQSCHHHHLGVRMPGVQFHDIQDTRGQMLSLLLLLVPPELQWLYLHLEDLLPATHLQDPSRCAEKTSALALNCLTLELCSKTSFGCDRSATLWWLLTWSRNVSKPWPARSEPHDRVRSGNLKDAIPIIQIYLDLFGDIHTILSRVLVEAGHCSLHHFCGFKFHVGGSVPDPMFIWQHPTLCWCSSHVCVSNSHTHGFIPTDVVLNSMMSSNG